MYSKINVCELKKVNKNFRKIKNKNLQILVIFPQN